MTSDGWKAELSAQNLKRVEDLERQLEKATKERNQRQMMNETLEQSLEKQKKKVNLTDTQKSPLESFPPRRQSVQKSANCRKIANSRFASPVFSFFNDNLHRSFFKIRTNL